MVSPLSVRTARSEALAVHLPRSDDSAKALAALEHLSPVFHRSVAALRRRASDQRRLRRLEAILEIANQWNQTREVEPLLVQMAEAATRLLAADRASIFLWDRPNHTLVGRPALGSPDGELRIPDDRGVVGEVIRSRPAPPRRCRRRAGRHRSQRRRPTPLPDPHAACASRCAAAPANCSAPSS